jgi:tetratricopeptide (TPR) repeat protein
VQPNINSLHNFGNYFWEQRDNKQNASRALDYLSRAHILDPNHTEVAVLLSRAYHFYGHYFENDPAKKDSLFLLGSSVAQTVLFSSSKFNLIVENTPGDGVTRMTAAIDSLDEDFVPALYWWAANFGHYLLEKSIQERLTHRDLIESVIHRMLSLNPYYYYGGPYRLMGVLYVRIPGVEIVHSETYFNLALESFPEYFSTAVLKAQYYCTKAGDRDQFRSLLISVLEADPSSIPEVFAENLHEQEKARQLLEIEELLFE